MRVRKDEERGSSEESERTPEGERGQGWRTARTAGVGFVREQKRRSGDRKRRRKGGETERNSDCGKEYNKVMRGLGVGPDCGKEYNKVMQGLGVGPDCGKKYNKVMRGLGVGPDCGKKYNKNAPPANNSVPKKPVVYVEKNDKSGKDKGGYGLYVVSGLVLIIGGIAGALLHYSKKKKSSKV
ncbi:hypothetical protein R1sor_013807 [Riccia sorocarpa]|uniref:Uncharacterized protein n=1 Tax=Riccia sorocarpa TaxID=122646 RepID=A0ABD3H7M7_9MARC